MGRRNGHIHALKTVRTEEYEVNRFEPDKPTYTTTREMNVFQCGDTSPVTATRDRFAKEGESVTCPACAKKLALAKLRERPAGAPTLRAEKDPEAGGMWRHGQGYKALIDDEVVAYLGYQDHSWRVYPLIIKRDDDERVVGPSRSPIANEGLARFSMYRLDSSALAYRTRDDALMACEDLRDEGRLKTAKELIDEADAHAREYAVLRQVEARKRSEAAERRADTYQGLLEIRGMLDLNNFQLAAIDTAIKAFAPKETAQQTD